MTADPAMPRAAVVTFGCKVNQCESAFLTQSLASSGWQVGTFDAAVSLVVVNTCTVTAAADRQARQFIRRVARQAPAAAVAVTGCYAQRAPVELAALPQVAWVLGTREKTNLTAFLTAPRPVSGVVVQVDGLGGPAVFGPLPLDSFPGRTRAFLKIQDGCDSHCSYCIVPRVRGPVRSLPLPQVLAQVDRLAAAGFPEIVLTGIHLGHYGRDLPGRPELTALVDALAARTYPCRFRLSSLEPLDVTPALLARLAAWPRFCPHFHLPLQSGSAAVLAAMQRPYLPADYRRIVAQVLSLFPAAAVGGDVMVGFPGETDHDFATTCALVDEFPLAYLHVFPYSPRPGTPAASLPGVLPPARLQARARLLRDLGRRKKLHFYQSMVGQQVEAVIEDAPDASGRLTALSDNYLRLLLPGPRRWINTIRPVRLVALEGERLLAVPA